MMEEFQCPRCQLEFRKRGGLSHHLASCTAGNLIQELREQKQRRIIKDTHVDIGTLEGRDFKNDGGTFLAEDALLVCLDALYSLSSSDF
jgi:uncharacterized C2H2 Zn-finger protein